MLDRNRLMVGFYALTVFVSASLLFVVQPMVGKMLLPFMGGSSSVWTTCMLFFQSMLVLGYVYAHLLARYVRPKNQIWTHLTIFAAACLFTLPLYVPAWVLTAESTPGLRVLAALLVGVGLPLFLVSTSAPLLQRWFSYTDHPDQADPYYLYAASNVGSMTALLAYPFVVEPLVGVARQRIGWSVLFVGLGLLAAACGWYLWQHRREPEALRREAAVHEDVSWWRRMRWIGLAFVPSSLMLGVTDYLTTDIASVPLLWVLPLAIYLGTFILVFARDPYYLPKWSRSVVPALVFVVLTASISELWMSMLIGLHLVVFFLLAQFFHGELAKDRPHTSGLTDFFIWMSVGGALGGLFNALVAPSILDRTLEYPIVLAVAVATITPNSDRIDTEFNPTGAVPVLFALLGFLYLWMLAFWTLYHPVYIGLALLACGVTFAVGYAIPRLENVAAAALIGLGIPYFMAVDGVVSYERSFFASYAVYESEYGGATYRTLSHGTTAHGVQAVEDGMRDTAFGYHHHKGPVGDVMESHPSERVLVAGLGAGAMAAYGNPDRQVTFFEIDPVVERIARRHFTYLKQCGDFCDVEIGDARKLLEQKQDDTYDVIMMDAYNSDSVPTHLLTREAMELYFDKLTPDGIALFHVSNRYLDIEGVVGSLADELGYVARTRLHLARHDVSSKLVYRSAYTVVARNKDDLGPLADDDNWNETRRAGVVWTDDYSNVVSVFHWRD